MKSIASYLLLISGCLLAFLPSPTGAQQPSDPDGIEFFERKIRPALVLHCYECHSKRADEFKGGLRLDLGETLRRGGASGPAIVPGQADQSLLIEAVRYQSLEMPPKGKLPDRLIADLVK